MLPKKNRVDKKLIGQIFKHGKFVGSHNIFLKFIKNNENHPKISFISPKNTSKRAVDRNLLKRRGYSILSKNIKLIPANLAGAFVFGKESIKFFGGRKNKTKNPFKNLENEIKKILNKIN